MSDVTEVSPWQIKLLGLYWYFTFCEWSEWHRADSDQRLRRAWWWLCHWPKYGKYCLRICGLTLFGRKSPHRRLTAAVTVEGKS